MGKALPIEDLAGGAVGIPVGGNHIGAHPAVSPALVQRPVIIVDVVAHLELGKGPGCKAQAGRQGLIEGVPPLGGEVILCAVIEIPPVGIQKGVIGIHRGGGAVELPVGVLNIAPLVIEGEIIRQFVLLDGAGSGNQHQAGGGGGSLHGGKNLPGIPPVEGGIPADGEIGNEAILHQEDAVLLQGAPQHPQPQHHSPQLLPEGEVLPQEVFQLLPQDGGVVPPLARHPQGPRRVICHGSHHDGGKDP